MYNFPEKSITKEGVCFNVNSMMRGWVGVNFPEKKRYLTLGSNARKRISEIVILEIFAEFFARPSVVIRQSR